MVFEDLGLLFFTALIFSLLLTPASISFAQKIGAMDSPVDRSVHVRIMPRLGGIGMAAAIVASLFLFLELDRILAGFLIGLLITASTGTLDDLYQIKPIQKMAGQVAACVAFLTISGLSLSTMGNLFSLGSIDFYGFGAFFVTIFFMVGTVNIFNLSDGLDGLAAGVTMIAAIFMGILALQSQNWLALSIVVSLIGAVFGFLKFNTYPAKLFMGDTGSLTLGFVVACLFVCLLDFQEQSSYIPPITIAIILAIPIFDTFLVMMRRILKGKSPASPDKTHLHHRLLELGFTHSAVVSLIYMLSFSFGLLALAFHEQAEWIQFSLGLGACVLLYACISLCEFLDCDVSRYVQDLSSTERTSSLMSIVGKSLKGLRFVILAGLLLPLAFVESAPSETYNLLLGVFVLLLFAYPWKEHTERLNIVYGLFYLTGLTILYVWNVSAYQGFSLPWYTLSFVVVLSVWSILKIRFKSHKEVFLTSGLEVLLIAVSWFIPYTLLPVLHVSEAVMAAAKTSCLEAIPLFIAMKIVIRRHPDRNYLMVVGLLMILLLMLIIL